MTTSDSPLHGGERGDDMGDDNMHNLLSETIMSDLSTRTLIPISGKKPQLSSISVIKSLSFNLQKHVISRNIYLSLYHLIHQNPF